MKAAFLPAIALALLLGYGAISQTPAVGAKHHVAFQLSEADDAAWSSLVVHVNNTMKALAGDGGADVEVVFCLPGLNMLKKTDGA